MTSLNGANNGNGHQRRAFICTDYLIGKKLPPTAWEVYAAISEWRIVRTDRTHPITITMIAERLGIARNHVPHHVGLLKAAGAIEVVERGRGPVRPPGCPGTVYRVVGTDSRSKHPDQPVEAGATVTSSGDRTVTSSGDRTVTSSGDSNYRGKEEGRSPEAKSFYIKNGGSAGRDAPLGAPSPSENAVKTAAHEAATYAKKARLKREQLIEKICRYLPTAYDGDELERRLVGLASPDPAVAQHWLDTIDRERKSRGWDDKPRRKAA
jgi:hypothetical protein